MEYEILKCNVRDGIACLTISRPQALNALNQRFFIEMNHWLDQMPAQKGIRALILTGDGKAFVAGADIAQMKDMSPKQAQDFSRVGQETFARLEDLEMPVIAAVNGYALGGGCELAMACDIRLASTFAKFGQPEVNLGLIPGFAGTQRLPRLVGTGNALVLLLSGETIAAEEALRVGLVQKVVAPEQLMPESQALAAKICSKGPRAVRLVKRLVRAGWHADFGHGCEREREEFSTLFGNEGTEGMTAFLEKRPPKW